MPKNRTSTTIIQTKLNRPPLPADMVRRPRLTTWLERHRSRPLTLASAPAGYGKSTLISCWLEGVDCPTAWLSLDEHDNELGAFLAYFLAAIETIFPNAVPETQAILLASRLPTSAAIATTLLNELNQIDEPFILVLDDYHLIDAQPIQDLLSEILTHPPRNLHLVLGTRIDPFLPIVTLRSKSQVTEIRIPDLRFNQAETQLLLVNMLDFPVDPAVVSEVDAQAEGWVTGLRLATLAMRHRIGRDYLPENLSLHNRYVTEYLVTEILAKQAQNRSACMLKISILERFSAGLCQAVCLQAQEQKGNATPPSESDGVQFLEWLQAANLFVIPLDDQNVWFRYHHIFREFLQQELVSRFSPEDIASLHAAAGSWYAQNGWIEEALNHLLNAGELSAAVHLVAQQRYSAMNNTQWPRLERLLDFFPNEIIETSAELWMLKTWLVYHRGQFNELPAMLQHLAVIVEHETNQQIAKDLIGEISSLRSLVSYHAGDFERAIPTARVALELLDPELWIVRIMARMYLGGSLLAIGDASGGYHAFYDAFEEEQVENKRFKATLLMTVCNFHWISADLQSMAQAAKQCIALCKKTDFQQMLGYGNYQLGRVLYQRNNLLAAEDLFASVVVRPYQNYGINYTNSACGLGLTYQAQGKEIEAQEVAEAAIAFLLETGNSSQLPYALALQAELALMQEHLPLASQWAEKLDPVPPLVPMIGFLAPHLTLVKVWLAQNTQTSQGKAAELLIQLQEYFSRTHNTRFLIETLALQARLEQTRRDQSAALAALNMAVRLAQPGGFIRLFVDMGPQMAVLLAQLTGDRGMQVYKEQIWAAFSGPMRTAQSLLLEELPEPLTNREWQILELLGKRLTNKEITGRLFISPGTVRQHTHNIYQKLAVRDRRQAAAKVAELGILSR